MHITVLPTECQKMRSKLLFSTFMAIIAVDKFVEACFDPTYLWLYLGLGRPAARRGLECTQAPGCKLYNTETIRFWIVGDWGGSKNFPFATLGQLQCANFIKAESVKQPHFFVSAGDNFYPKGVQNVNDERFNFTFDNVFDYGKEDHVPWYVTLGNHDWMDNPQAQLEYSQINDRWVCPSYFFKASYDARPKGPKIDLVFIDTIVLCGKTVDKSKLQEPSIQTQVRKLGTRAIEYFGPEFPDAAETMWQWIEHEMAMSQADYLFLVGHYPAFESGEDGISWCLVPRLHELLEKYNATGYLAGHAHTLEHIETISRFYGNLKINYVISGAAHGTEAIYADVFGSLNPNPYQARSKYFYPTVMINGQVEREDEGAIVFAELGPKNGTFDYYHCNGQKLHSLDVQARYA